MSQQVSLRSIWPSVYVPSLLFGIGQGAIAPVVALSAREHGASVAVASLVVAVMGVGRIVGDLPAGLLAVRVGERNAMLLATVLAVAGLALAVVATSPWVLALAVAVVGVATAVWGLARHAYLTEIMPYVLRARALSTLGGTQRIGLFVGPFVGAAAMRWTGTDGGYWVHIAMAAAAASLLMLLPPPPSSAGTTGRAGPDGTTHTGTQRPEAKPDRMAQVIRRHLPVLRTLGMGALIVGAVRASRQVVIPLWAEHVGIDPATASVIFGIAGGVDMLLFYPAGLAMDRLGRRWVVVASMLVLGASHLVIPLTHSAATLAAAAVMMGLGNGMGSGIIMTVGADVSPRTSRATFLGAWRLCSDVGNGLGPVVISGVTAWAALAPAIMTMGAAGGLAALAMGYWIPRFGADRS